MKIIKKNIKKVIDNTILCVSIKLFFLHFFNQYPNAQVNIYLKNNMAAEKCYGKKTFGTAITTYWY